MPRRGRWPSAIGLGPPPLIAPSTRSRGTQAWTIAEIAKPNTSAHQTSHAIRNASCRPLQITFTTSTMNRTVAYP